jgi:hypothetical protein
MTDAFRVEQRRGKIVATLLPLRQRRPHGDVARIILHKKSNNGLHEKVVTKGER